MSEAIKPLEEVRRKIDEIDAALHGLIMERTRVVEQVIAAKGTTNTGNFIPGREIKVLRGLMSRLHCVRHQVLAISQLRTPAEHPRRIATSF